MEWFLVEFKILRGFWSRGRVRGDRSVFVTSHRPVHFSRALMFSAWFELLHFRTGAIFLVWWFCVSAFEYAHIQGIVTGVRTGVFVWTSHAASSVPQVHRTAFTATTASVQTVSKWAVLRHLIWCSPFRQGSSLKNFLVHSQLSTMICAALACSLSTGTRIRIVMHGCDNTFRLSSTVSRFSYISGVVNSQRAGPEVRFTSPAFRSPASCKPTAPSSFTTTGGNGSKRRYAAITSGGRHRQRQSSFQPPDGPLLSKAAREQEEYQQVLEVTLNLIASLGHLPGLTQELNSSTLCSVGQVSRLRKSFLQPRNQLVRFERITCRSSGFCYGVPTENFHRASVFSKLQYRRCRFHGKVGSPRFFGAMRGSALKTPSGKKLDHVFSQTLRFMVFAGTLNLEVSQACLGRHCVAVYWMKTGRSMRGTTSW